MRICRRNHEILYISLLALICLVLPVQESVGQDRRAGSANTSIKPIYNPETKSYFELRVDLPKPPQWRTAVRDAPAPKPYEGVRGRLADGRRPPDPQLPEGEFRYSLNEQAWIGLAVFSAAVRKLVWADGT